ncbi:MAG: rRNA pseudouridine synthase [Planctomycetaceae bacterium]|nr:rRNA pseudouridine synthase [Planctomycetaceae bacterium]
MPPPSKQPQRRPNRKPVRKSPAGKSTARKSVSNQPAPPQEDAPAPNTGLVRLQRVLAGAGCGSRRACEEMIVAGRVKVDGEVVTTLGIKVDPNTQQIQLDGKKLKLEKKVYFAVNKPPGYLCTNNDPAGRLRVIDILPPVSERLFTVGRLDESSQGLIVVTNDGLLSQKLAHPSFRVRKVYRVLVAGTPTREELQSLRAGHQFHEGKFKVDSVRELRTVGQATLLEIVLREGKNREIRRLLARIGHKVMQLQRVQLGPLRLGTLKLGRCRLLTRDEVLRLRRADQYQPEEETPGKSPRSQNRRPKRPTGKMDSPPKTDSPPPASRKHDARSAPRNQAPRTTGKRRR